MSATVMVCPARCSRYSWGASRRAGVPEACRVEGVERRPDAGEPPVDRVVRGRRAAVPALRLQRCGDLDGSGEDRVSARLGPGRRDRHLEVADRQVGALNPRVHGRQLGGVVVSPAGRLGVRVDRAVREHVSGRHDGEVRVRVRRGRGRSGRHRGGGLRAAGPDAARDHGCRLVERPVHGVTRGAARAEGDNDRDDHKQRRLRPGPSMPHAPRVLVPTSRSLGRTAGLRRRLSYAGAWSSGEGGACSSCP